MKKGLISLLTLLGVTVAFAQEKPKVISTELIQLKVDPRYKAENKQLQSAGNVKTLRVVEMKQKPNTNTSDPTPQKAVLRPAPKKQEKPIQEINNK